MNLQLAVTHHLAVDSASTHAMKNVNSTHAAQKYGTNRYLSRLHQQLTQSLFFSSGCGSILISTCLSFDSLCKVSRLRVVHAAIHQSLLPRHNFLSNIFSLSPNSLRSRRAQPIKRSPTRGTLEKKQLSMSSVLSSIAISRQKTWNVVSLH